MKFIAYAVTVTALATSLVITADSAHAQTEKRLTSCKVGQRVVLPGGQLGTVISLSGNQGCNVQADGYKDYNTWSAWMLAPAPGSAAAAAKPSATTGGTPAPGNYQCYGGPAGNMKLSFFAGNGYANEQGKRGFYKMGADGQLAFTSGPWAGFYAKKLGPNKVGLTSKPGGTFYYMTCDRK